MQLVGYYATGLYFSSATIKNLAVQFTTGILLKKGKHVSIWGVSIWFKPVFGPWLRGDFDENKYSYP